MNVSSWLLISLSDVEWISCTVGLNQKEVRESKIVPHKGKLSVTVHSEINVVAGVVSSNELLSRNPTSYPLS